MSGNKPDTGSDLERIDARPVTPEDLEEVPELSEEWFETADHHRGGKLVSRGRPKGSGKKVQVTLRLDADVVARYRATGRGWQSRINADLKEVLHKGDHP